MQFKQGTGVFTVDGREVGHIDRVVMEPQTKEVTHVVVRKGFLFTDDKVVPIDFIATATEDRVALRSDVGDLNALPKFEETHYIPIPDTVPGTAPSAKDSTPLYWYPPIGLTPWGAPDAAQLGPVYVSHTEQNIPEGTVALKEGSKVISSDEKHVGNVERVFTDSRTNRVTHLLISQGLILTERRLVPITWVRLVLEDEVHLTVNSQQLDSLPQYQDKPDPASAGA